VEVDGGLRFVFPTRDVAVVPVAATTAELLAEHLARAVMAGLATAAIGGVRAVTVDVEESPGQSGVCRLEADPTRA
jgi:hypothetical protein